MYRVLVAASLTAGLGLATAVLPAHAAGQLAPRGVRIGPVQPVIPNPGIGVLHRPQTARHARHLFNSGNLRSHVNFGHRNFNNFGLNSGFLFVDGLNGIGGSTNTNTIVNNVTSSLVGSGVQEATGIREAPPARPAIYVIDEAGPRQRTQRQGGARVVEQGAAGWAELEETSAQDSYSPRIIRVPVR